MTEDFQTKAERNVKAISIFLVAVPYIAGTVIGIICFKYLSRLIPELWALLTADVLVTIIVWATGLKYRNVSVYDPYWSVAPPVIFTAWAFYKHCFSLPVILLLIAVTSKKEVERETDVKDQKK